MSVPTDIYPLSLGQSAVRYVHLRFPASAMYNVGAALRLRSVVDPARLATALDVVGQRHPTLRAVIEDGGDGPQHVVRDRGPQLALVDAAGWDDARLAHYLEEEVRRPIRLEVAPSWRVLLIRRADDDQTLLLITHHIHTDLITRSTVLDELFACYTRGPSALPPVPPPFADYVAWQARYLASEEANAAERWWRQHLAGAQVASLPMRMGEAQSGESRLLSLGERETAALRALARDVGCNLDGALLALLAAAVARHGGGDDVTVACVTTARPPGFERTLGYLENSLPIRVDLSGRPDARTLLARVRDELDRALALRLFPYPRIVQALGGVEHARVSVNHLRDVPGNPVRSVMELGPTPPCRWELHGIDVETWRLPQQEGQHDVSLWASEHAGRLWLDLKLSDAIDPAVGDRLAERLLQLVDGATTHPKARVDTIPILSREERDQLLVEWNATTREYARDTCVHELFEAQADRTPDAVAATFEGRELSYRELEVRSNQLAHRLKKLGVGPDVLVGICVERSLDMLVGLLGILKAGGAYLPLDPSYPRDRLAFMIEDAAVTVLVTQSRLVAKLPPHHARVVPVDDAGGLAMESGARRSGAGSVEHVAYVIYTSGSTGQPNGVVVSHRGLANLVAWHRRAFAITAEDRATQVASLSFDASTWEIWPYLAAGASIHIVGDETRASPRALLQALVDQRITVSFLPTPLVEPLLELSQPSAASLRVLLTGGDRLRIRPAHAMPFRFVNNYGPTECSVVTTSGDVSPDQPNARPPSIGRPIDNCCTYVLDGNGTPVPIGVPGELYIGGEGLARGYLKRPALTAERFVPNPFGRGRLYRTGDLVRWLPDGTIEFVGRNDFQVKIRGLRIDLAEIEVQLGQHPWVREAVVLAREDSPGEKRLVAYVIAAPSVVIESELRTHLERRLPAYMVPSAFVALDAFPLTPNGKVDRVALPKPDGDVRVGPYDPPSTPAEVALAKIWAELLKLDRVGKGDNFFHLGGHSLLAMQLLSRVRGHGLRLELEDVFDHPTLRALAHRADALGARHIEEEDPPVEPTELGRERPASFQQQRSLRWGGDNRAMELTMLFRMRGPLDVDAFERSLVEIVRRHQVLRSVFVFRDDDVVQRVLPLDAFRVRHVDLRARPEHERVAEIHRRSLVDAHPTIDLRNEPSLRVELLRTANEEHVFSALINHNSWDGWSRGVFLEELRVLYNAFSRGQPSPLPEPRLQYADYAVWQRTRFSGAQRDEQLAFWREQFRDLPAMRLPVDRFVTEPSGPNASIDFTLADIGHRIAATETTPFTLCLAALVEQLRSVNEGDISLGVLFANRVRPELHSLIGFFVNPMFVRVNVSAGADFRDVLRATERTTRALRNRQGASWMDLMSAQELATLSLPIVMFNFHNYYAAEHRFLDVEIEDLPGSYIAEQRFGIAYELGMAGGDLRGELAYRTDQFEAVSARRLLADYLATVERAASNSPPTR